MFSLNLGSPVGNHLISSVQSLWVHSSELGSFGLSLESIQCNPLGLALRGESHLHLDFFCTIITFVIMTIDVSLCQYSFDLLILTFSTSSLLKVDNYTMLLLKKNRTL